MSFFGAFFKRDHIHYLTKGEEYFAAGRYADARAAFQSALEVSCPANIKRDEAAIKMRLAEAGNRLALINIDEARHSIGIMDNKRAEDHLRLAIALTEDPTTRQLAENMLTSLPRDLAKEIKTKGDHGCAGCGSEASEMTESFATEEHLLPPAERYELLIQTLPADLPERYSTLGEDFAKAYLLAQDDQYKAAEAKFAQIEEKPENRDILLYERGVVYHRQGKIADAEALFTKTISICESNPLPHLALVQLLVESRRLAEACSLLKRMIEKEILQNEASLYLADVYTMLGQEEDAISVLGSLLTTPLKKEAAGRLLALLEKTGQSQQAAHIAKNYLKGCC